MTSICLNCGLPLDNPNRLFCGYCPDIPQPDTYDQARDDQPDHMDDMLADDETGWETVQV